MFMQYADLNFKVSSEFHEKYLLAATLNGKKMTHVLRESFALWLAVHDADGHIADVHTEMVERRKSHSH
jgi:hypothetical protein